MNSEVISFFYDFNCKADLCKDNCCRGWKIDDSIKMCLGKCVHQCKNGLCKLQLEGSGDKMPQICKQYPRYTVSYGGYELGVIDLSCESGVELFLKQEGRLKFIPAKEPLEIFWNLENADEPFAKILRDDLEKVLDVVWTAKNTGDFTEVQKSVFKHVYAMHLKLVKADIEASANVPFELDKMNEEDRSRMPWLVTERCKEIYNGLFILPMSFVNEVIYNEFSDLYLYIYHKDAANLIKKYKKYFGKIYETKADGFFMDKFNALTEKYDFLYDKILSYFSYKLQILYIGASVDYYVLEPVITAMFATQVLILFLITYCEKNTLDMEALTNLIEKTERLISHNSDFNERLMDKVRKELI